MVLIRPATLLTALVLIAAALFPWQNYLPKTATAISLAASASSAPLTEVRPLADGTLSYTFRCNENKWSMWLLTEQITETPGDCTKEGFAAAAKIFDQVGAWVRKGLNAQLEQLGLPIIP